MEKVHYSYKIIEAAIAISVILALLVPASIANPLDSDTMSIPETHADKGATVTIPIEGEWSQTLSGFSIGLQFDPTAVAITDIEKQDTISENAFIFSYFEVSPGLISLGVAFMPNDYPLPGSGVLANLMVNISIDAPGNSTLLDLDDFGGQPAVQCAYSDEFSQLIFPDLSDGIIQFTGETYVCGDLNNDGAVNIVDLTSIVEYLFGTSGYSPDPLCVADLNGDGSVNIVDLTYMVQYLFGEGIPPVDDCCNPVW